jgi:hypothetical protein
MVFLLLGGPGETSDTVRESFQFADSLELESMKVTAGIRIYPGTALARLAGEEGMTDPRDDLLFPKFYMRPDLRDWLLEAVRDMAEKRPEWMC